MSDDLQAGSPPVEGFGVQRPTLPRGITETGTELKKHWFVGSIDQGTTSARFLIFNGAGEPVASHQIVLENIYPHSG
jgi:glycerol kinase